MKKYAVILTSILLFVVVACGPSAKQIEEKRVSDSISMKCYTDSVNQVKIADSLLKVKQDSIKKDSIAKATKTPVKKAKTAKKAK